MYVGYMYTNGKNHGLSISSVIKKANDDFYKSKIASYASYIDTSQGFCGDRGTLSNQSNAGIDKTLTYYKGYLRALESDPTLKCENNLDYYTATNTSNGNSVLTYPIGLVTVDEAILAGSGGGFFDGTYYYQKTNKNGYLINGYEFWTMTPVNGANRIDTGEWYSSVFTILDSKSKSYGGLDDTNTAIRSITIRPVINLKGTLKFTGNGTKNNPYVPSL